MDISEKIKRRRLELKMTMDDLAEALGVNKSTISRYESDQIKKMPIDIILPLAEALRCSPEYLMGWEDNVEIEMSSPEPTVTIGIWEPLSCGGGIFVDDKMVGTVSVPKSLLPRGKKEFFGQYAKGDSMIGKNINDGDLLIFSKEQCESGDIGCFCIDENIATCKTLRIVGDQIMLMPANDKYEPIICDVEQFRCVGKLALVVSKR